MARTDQDLLDALQRDLVITPDAAPDVPLWATETLLGSLNERRHELLQHAALTAQTAIVVGLAGVHRYEKPAGCLRLLRVAWLPAGGGVAPLHRSESFELDHATPTWPHGRETTPLVFTEADLPDSQFAIAPAPLDHGTLHLVYVPRGTAMDGSGVALGVPEEFFPALAKGALADLYGPSGPGQDLQIAQHADRIWTDHLALARWLLGDPPPPTGGA